MNNQPDTTNMPEFESEESAEQRRNQQGKGLKILTPNEMLSRLTISLAQKSLKMKLDNYYIPCTDQKSLQKKSIKV